MKRRRLRTVEHTTTNSLRKGVALMTDAEIADELNRRHDTTRNNRKNVAAVRFHAERKLRERLAAIFAEHVGDHSHEGKATP